MECGTCFVSGCGPSPELDLQDQFWLMQKQQTLRRTTGQEFFSSNQIFWRDTQQEFGKKTFFISLAQDIFL